MKRRLIAETAARRRRSAWFDADSQRTSEVARVASETQKQTGCSRTEALLAAEKHIQQVQ